MPPTVSTVAKSLGTVEVKFFFNSTTFTTTSSTFVEVTTMNFNGLSIANNQYYGFRLNAEYHHGSLNVAGAIKMEEQNTGSLNSFSTEIAAGTNGILRQYWGGSDGQKNTSNQTWNSWKFYARVNQHYGGTTKVYADASGTNGYFKVYQGERYYNTKTTTSKKLSLNFKLYINEIKVYGMYDLYSGYYAGSTTYSTTASYYDTPVIFDTSSNTISTHKAPQTISINAVTTDGLTVNVGDENPTNLWVYYSYSGSQLAIS